MKYLFIETFQHSPEFEMSMEMVVRLFDEGHKIYYAHVGEQLPFSEWHSFKPVDKIKRKLVKKIERGTLFLKNYAEIIQELPLNNHQIKSLYKEFIFESISSLKKFDIDGFDCGMGVASSLISIYSDSILDTRKHHLEINNAIWSSRILFRSTIEYIDKLNPDVVCFFNNRIATSRAILRACQAKGVSYKIREVGSSIFKFEIFNNEIHDFDYVQDRIIAYCNKSQEDWKEMGAQFYWETRFSKKNGAIVDFVKYQQKKPSTNTFQ